METAYIFAEYKDKESTVKMESRNPKYKTNNMLRGEMRVSACMHVIPFAKKSYRTYVSPDVWKQS